MATKHVSDRQVLYACALASEMNYARWPYDLLAEWTGQVEKVCFRAMERAEARGYLEYGVSLRTAWLTQKGVAYLQAEAARQWWQAHPLDHFDQLQLLDIAHSAAPPDTSPDWSDLTLPARDGWQVCFFYDCGDLDYIDHFISPRGERLDVWVDGYQSEQWPPVMLWRGMRDTERLRKLLQGTPSGQKPSFAGEK